ncbi:MAG: hypothetical protein ACPGXL_03010 [Chitinophagales bacterium]
MTIYTRFLKFRWIVMFLLCSFGFNLSSNAQCFLKIIRLSDTSIKIEATGNSTASSATGAQIQFVIADLFASTPAASSIFTKSGNTLTVNGLGPTPFGGATGCCIGLPYDDGSFTGFSGPISATGEITLTWADGVIASAGTMVDINHSSYTNTICTVPIESNAVTPTVTLAISNTPTSVIENSGTALNYVFSRTGATTAALSVNFKVNTGSSTASDGDYTIGGTGVSYTVGTHTGTITIPISSSTATLTVIPTGDTTIETDETVVIEIDN